MGTLVMCCGSMQRLRIAAVPSFCFIIILFLTHIYLSFNDLNINVVFELNITWNKLISIDISILIIYCIS